ncbi:MAG: hypothetical protein ACUVT2_09555 [Thiobacillaceae bacterium]
MPISPDYTGYLEQLARLPGGPAAAVTDFLAPWLADAATAADPASNCWQLKQGDRLCLAALSATSALLLTYVQDTQSVEIARFGRALSEAVKRAPAGKPAVSPLVLALLAIAAGDVDDGRLLKRHLPGLDAAAKDLMLMTLCRLCG